MSNTTSLCLRTWLTCKTSHLFRVIVYEGAPGVKCKANAPQSLVSGMNKFLNLLGITFRRDPTNFRPRINKLESQLDKEQKLSGNYFCLEE